MAINLNDNFYINAGKPADKKFGPYSSIVQAHTSIPRSQRYNGLIFAVYNNPDNLIDTDITLYYYYGDFTDVKYRKLLEAGASVRYDINNQNLTLLEKDNARRNINAQETIILDPARVAISDAAGEIINSIITVTELNALSGVTSNIQEQINNLDFSVTLGAGLSFDSFGKIQLGILNLGTREINSETTNLHIASGSGHLHLSDTQLRLVSSIGVNMIFGDTGKNTFTDILYNKGLEYGGNYEANFTPTSLITKQFAESLIEAAKVSLGVGLSFDSFGKIQLGTVATGTRSILSETDGLIISTTSGQLVLSQNETTLSGPSGSITINPLNLTLSLSGKSSMVLGDGGNIFNDITFSKGLVYGGEYELNFTARSLITKQYVDAVLADFLATIPPPAIELGMGLSFDSENKIRLGDQTFLTYLNTGEDKNYIYNTTETINGVTRYIYEDLYLSPLSIGKTVNINSGGQTAFIRTSINSSNRLRAEFGFLDQENKQLKTFIEKNSTGVSQFLIIDEINNKGVEYAGDYELNFSARSLITKQYADGLISGDTRINGTTNFISKFTSSTTIGNSNIFDNGNVGIFTNNPLYGFHILRGDNTDTLLVAEHTAPNKYATNNVLTDVSGASIASFGSTYPEWQGSRWAGRSGLYINSGKVNKTLNIWIGTKTLLNGLPTGEIAIGQQDPQAWLHIQGNLMVDNVVNKIGDILTIDGNGLVGRRTVTEILDDNIDGGLELVPFNPIINISGNFKSTHIQTGVINYTVNSVDPVENFGNRSEHYIQSDGINGKPNFDTQFVKMLDNWNNITNEWNLIIHKALPNGKIAYWIYDLA